MNVYCNFLLCSFVIIQHLMYFYTFQSFRQTPKMDEDIRPTRNALTKNCYGGSENSMQELGCGEIRKSLESLSLASVDEEEDYDSATALHVLQHFTLTNSPSYCWLSLHPNASMIYLQYP